jgi:hypothetical protein
LARGDGREGACDAVAGITADIAIGGEVRVSRQPCSGGDALRTMLAGQGRIGRGGSRAAAAPGRSRLSQPGGAHARQGEHASARQSETARLAQRQAFGYKERLAAVRMAAKPEWCVPHPTPGSSIGPCHMQTEDNGTPGWCGQKLAGLYRAWHNVRPLPTLV